MTARKPYFLFILLLAVVTTAGWRTGSAVRPSKGSSTGTGEAGKEAAPAQGRISGTPKSSASPINKMVGGFTIPDAAAIKGELDELLRSGKDENGPRGGMLQVAGMARIACIFERLTTEERDALLAIFPEKDNQQLKMMITSFSSMLTTGTPKTVHDYVKELEACREVGQGMELGILFSWASTDPAGMLQYWKTQVALPNPPEWAVENCGGIFSNVSYMNPRATLAEALTIPDEKLRREAVGSIWLAGLCGGTKEEWPADASDLIRTQIESAPSDRERALTFALTARLKQETPREAMTWIESLNLGPESKAWTDQSLLNAWWQKDHREAADWKLANTPPEGKAAVVEEMVLRWTDGAATREERRSRPEPDIAACADWILSLGLGPDTESGISRLADGWIDAGEPAAALAWAQAIENPQARQATLNNVTTQIQRRYPDTWRAMLTAAGLLPAGD